MHFKKSVKDSAKFSELWREEERDTHTESDVVFTFELCRNTRALSDHFDDRLPHLVELRIQARPLNNRLQERIARGDERRRPNGSGAN
jgi:hypothetical protein